MLKLSRMADYAVVVLGHIAASEDPLLTAPQIADATGLGEATTSKLLKTLTRKNLLRSVRGARGGYGLSKPLSQISIAEIVQSIDGPIAVTRCANRMAPACSLSETCNTKNAWQQINTQIHNVLDNVSLADVVNLAKTPCATQCPTAARMSA